MGKIFFLLKRILRIVTVECKDCHHHDNGFCKKFQKLDRPAGEWLKSRTAMYLNCDTQEARQEGNCGKYGHHFRRKQ